MFSWFKSFTKDDATTKKKDTRKREKKRLLETQNFCFRWKLIEGKKKQLTEERKIDANKRLK